MLYPLTFQPIFKERVWGGRKLAGLYGKALPPAVPIGESWEITDRPEGVSVITNGLLAGKTLRWLMEHHARDVLGGARPAAEGRFPLLVKLLDAREKLSLQVHPPAHKAAELGGEPKTEMWYFADCDPGADIFVGLRRGVTRAEFERRTADGTVADCFHRIEVGRGDTMFLQSGRVHALGAGSVLFEIQQNSDTTYRVFDWNRTGLDGKPRDLHIPQALASIDFNDFEPPLVKAKLEGPIEAQTCTLADNDLFVTALFCIASEQTLEWHQPQLRVVGVVEGELLLTGGALRGGTVLKPGQFAVIPAVIPDTEFTATKADCTFLVSAPK